MGVAAEDRVRGPIETDASIPLHGSVSPKLRRTNDRGLLDSATRINSVKLVLAQTDLQRADLEQFLEQQRDPASPDYQNWLTPEQYGERFGLSENDLAAISSWLQSSGFAVEQVARARNWITFNATADQIARVFHVELHHVEVDGQAHFANISDAWIPASLAGVVDSIRGLDDFRPEPHRVKSILHPEFNSSNGSHYLSPGDLATIYDIQALYTDGFDGTGQKLVITGQTDMSLTDLRAFRAEFNLPARDPQMVLFGADPGANEDDQIEASLDLEWSGAVARYATIVYVYSQNVFESIQYAIDQNLAPVISMSYGGCELEAISSFRALAQQANAQGITWMNASGDSGAAGCDGDGQQVAKQGPAATFPADIPEVTAVGGTEFIDAGGPYWNPQNGTNLASALSYIPEKAWNDTALGSGLAAGGGAPSLVYPKPWWQTGPGVPNDQARDVPDVSLAASGAHDGYLMYFRGELMAVGGTSASSPSFAGIVAILNQYLAAKGSISKPGLGNINPALYNLAQNTSGVFHDITADNNIVPCAAGSKGCVNGSFGYNAGPGYDLPTGLGSVDAYNLVTKWASLPPVAGTSMTLTATPATVSASATVQLTAAVTAVSGTSTPAGTVTFANGNTPLGSATLTGSGSTTTATLAVKGTSLALGVNAITAGYGNSAAATTVSVTAPAAVTPIFTSTVVTAIPQGTSWVLTATVKQATGGNVPTGTVTFSPGGIANLVTGVATLSVKSSTLAVGADTIVANYAATGNFTNSRGSVIVTVAPPAIVPIATNTVVTASPPVIAQSSSIVLTASIRGNGTPTGTVSFSTGNTTLGSAVVSAGVAVITIKGSSLAVGNNTITASYAATGTFTNSSSSVTVDVTSPPVATMIAVSASLGVKASTTVLTATVKAASGSVVPTGSVTFALGARLLGSGVLIPSGTSATGTLTLNNNVLVSGSNSIAVNYPGAVGFSSSTASVIVATH
jgi:subtilase family serine protease